MLQNVERAIADHGLEEGHELGSRGTAKLREAAGIERRQRVGEDVVGVSRRQAKRLERAPTDLLEWCEEGPPGLWVAIPTAFHQIEEVRADGLVLRWHRESSTSADAREPRQSRL